MLSLNIGDKNKAIGYFTEANENFSSVNAYYKMGLVFSSLGKLYEEDHDFLIAKNNLLHALDMFRQVGSLKEEFNTLLQLRDIARMLSDFEGEKTFTKLSDEIQIRLLN